MAHAFTCILHSCYANGRNSYCTLAPYGYATVLGRHRQSNNTMVRFTTSIHVNAKA